MPVICSNSTMNTLCSYIESINFNILQKLKVDNVNNINLYKNNNVKYSKKEYDDIINFFKIILKEEKQLNVNSEIINLEINSVATDKYKNIKKQLLEAGYDLDIIVNVLIDYYYIEKNKSNKDILWNLYGDIIFKNVLTNTKEPILFPFYDENGNIEYMNKKYTWKEVDIY